MSDNVFGAGTGPQDSDIVPPENLSYEQARAELEETVKILELGRMPLDEALQFWERGESLARRCEELLDGAAKRVEDALGAPSGEPDSR